MVKEFLKCNSIRERIQFLANTVLKDWDASELDTPADAFSFEDKHWHTQVMQRVKRLPEAQRNAVFLVYVEGFTYQEAAMTLSVPVGTIMSRLASARLTLAQHAGKSSRQGEKK